MVNVRFCIVCGMADNEVRKLFCFPRRSERSNQWQLEMGMKPKGVLHSDVRICDRHFREESFIPCTFTLRLKVDAVPTIAFTDHPQPSTPGPTDPNGMCEKHESESFPPSTPQSSATTDFIQPSCSSSETSKIMNENKRKRQKSVDSADLPPAAVHEKLETVTSEEKDRFNIAGKAIAAKLRSLPHIQRIFADKLIQDVLFEAEMGTLSRSCKLLIEPTTEINLTHAETVQTVGKADAEGMHLKADRRDRIHRRLRLDGGPRRPDPTGRQRAGRRRPLEGAPQDTGRPADRRRHARRPPPKGERTVPYAHIRREKYSFYVHPHRLCNVTIIDGSAADFEKK